MNLYKILFLVSIYLAFVNCLNGFENCPEIYDGLTNARFDLQTQYSSNSISANWKPSMNAIKYEWAIISENQYKNIKELEQCRNSIGFNAIPDVQDWKNVNLLNFASNDELVLKERERYYVVVRTTFKDGQQSYSHSNGVLIVPQPEEEAIALDEVVEKKHNDMLVSHLKRDLEYVQERAHIAVPDPDECPIDAENRCAASKIRVYDRLTEIYGPPIFDDERPIRDDDDGDDDDGDDDDDSSALGSYPAGIVGAIIGILALLAILCCLLALVGFFVAAVGGGGDDDKFNQRVYAKSSEDVDTEYGTKDEYKVEDSTRVEFPDIDPHSRLSQI